MEKEVKRVNDLEEEEKELTEEEVNLYGNCGNTAATMIVSFHLHRY